MLKNIDGYKTYLIASLTIVYAVIGVGLGFHDHSAAVEMILAALGLSTLRHGVAKTRR